VSKSTFHIPSLDGLRAISFGIVFASHAGFGGVPGIFGVTVFFFLSGFLITTLIRAEAEKTGTVSLPKFYLRRVLRILPPFYLVLVAATLLTIAGLLPGPLVNQSVAAQALHYANFWIINHGYGGFAPGTGVYWSLAVEEHFYLLFPLFYLVLRRTFAKASTQVIALFAVCAFILVWRCVLVFALHSSVERTAVGSDTRFDSILFGCALALYGNPVLDPTNISERVWKRVLFPLGIAGLVTSFAIRNQSFRESLRYSLQGVSLIPVFVCAVRYPDWIVMRPLNWKPVAYLGLLSYSLYLMHQVVLYAITYRFGSNIGAIPLAASGFAVSLVLAWCVYWVVERPCATLRRRFSA
jgi:peptidoglycan/LPS O-acetylase OafA/YrhL